MSASIGYGASRAVMTFVYNAADVVGLYLNPPQNALVLSVDERPSIQALERAQGFLRLPDGNRSTASVMATNVTARPHRSRRWP